MWNSNLLREKLQVLISLLNVGCHKMGGVMLILHLLHRYASPTHFDMDLLSFTQCIGVSQPVFRVCFCFSEKVVPYVAVDLVCLWEDVSSGSCYVTILNGNLYYFFK